MKTAAIDYNRYSYINSYFTPGQKYKIYLLVFFLVIYPFIKVFSSYQYLIPVADPLFIWSVFNFIAILGCFLAFLLHEKEYSLRVILVAISIITLMVANYFLSEMAQVKWLFNWLGFLFIFAVVAQLVKSLTDAEMYILQIKLISVFKIVIGLLTVLTFYALVIEPWYMDARLFNYYVFEERNHIHALYRYHIGSNKQHFGIFSLLISTFVFTHWKMLSKKVQFLVIIFFTVNLVAIIGVRTVILSSIVGIMALYFLKNGLRKLLAFLIGILSLLILYIYWSEIVDVIILLYDRFPALNFAVNAMTENVFGIGNGAYTIYVLENNDRLLAQFGSELMERHGLFWKAPESDLVYFIASWGILSIFFFAFLGFLIFRAAKLYHFEPSLFPIEKFVLVFTVLLVFMGISEDNAGELTWWVFVSSLFGIIQRRHMMKEDEETFRFEQLEYVSNTDEK